MVGQTVWNSEYAPFGQVTKDDSGFNKAIKFTGKDLDLETGLYYFNARWYDSDIGRFISEDPIKDGLNWYTYAVSNPLMYVDPSGLDAIPIVFKDYLIETLIGRLPHLGHAGVLLINNETGYTRYYEYGRYDKPEKLGIARNVRVSNVQINEQTGLPTTESLNEVLKTISEKAGQGGVIAGAYIKNDDFDSMDKFAQEWVNKSDDLGRKKYSLYTWNCLHFVKEVIEAGGVDMPKIISPRPNAYIKKIQRQYPEIAYE